MSQPATVRSTDLFGQFKQEYINKGIEGGKQAAYALRTAILKECHSLAGEIEVIARVVANLSGLAKAMRNDGSLDHESRLKDFTIGFSQGMASFDFIDIGFGKERADTKIKGKSKTGLGQSPRKPSADSPPQRRSGGTCAITTVSNLCLGSHMTLVMPHFWMKYFETKQAGGASQFSRAPPQLGTLPRRTSTP